MNEALALGQSYEVIQKFAEDVEARTKLRSLYDISTVIQMSGGTLRKVGLDEWNAGEFPFVEVYGSKNYTISVCAQFPEELQRLLLVQGLGHYFLHAEAGQKPCIVSSPARHPASREGLWFSLALLIPDKAFVGLKDALDEQMLAHFFRVPVNMISVKKKIMKSVTQGLQNVSSLT